ncbi:MAG: PAS domain S-box protein [Luteolibacter sp.]|uniref:sensor histidine kinase n=1 Tax=Luteolibacter sp. TaxID=1962973 RepID=UPI0032650A46
MPTKPKTSETPAELRRRAEKKSMELLTETPVPRTKVDTQRLLHELEVHQIELEMQNAELRRARDEAESVRELYADLYDFAPVGYFTILMDGSIKRVNLAGAALVGMERSRLVGRSFEMLVPSDLRASFSVFLAKSFTGKTGLSIESGLMQKGQADRFVAINAQRSPDGKECSVTVTDITGRKHDEDALRESEIRYRRLFEAAHDGILLVDPGTYKITDANPFMTKLLGFSQQELVCKELCEIGLLEDEPACQEMFRRLKKNHEVRYENLPLKGEGGRHQEVEVVANLYRENGRPVIQCNIRDITVRKQAEDMLRQNEALFSALIGQAPVSVFVVDARFRLLHANPPALKIFANVDPLIDRDFSEILHLLWPKKAADSTTALFRHTLKTGEPYYTPEFTERRRDIAQEQIYEWQIERVTLPSEEHGVVCFFNDITARIRAEKSQRDLEVMTASNLKLKKEIIRRQALEKDLHQTRAEETRLLTQSRKQELRLRDLSHRILHVQEEERKRISRELHDVIAQTLVGINVHVSALAQETNSDIDNLQERIASTHRMVEKSVDIVHQFARELRPTLLDDLGLIPALQTHLKEFMEETGIRVSLKAFAGIEKVPEIIRTTFYRIAQEALTNVTKHARATTVEISIHKVTGGISLEITDDGEGFEVNGNPPLKRKGRLGLIGMRERAEMIGGIFSVASAPGAPTTVRVLVESARSKAKKPASKKAAGTPTAKHS